MINQDLSNKKQKLTNTEIVQKFLNVRKNSIAIEKVVYDIERKLSTSYTLEDMAFVLSDVETITPEQQALMQINANMSVAGTDLDADSMQPTNMSKESFTELSKDSVCEVNQTFLESWDKITEAFTNLDAINKEVLTETMIVANAVNQIKAETSTDINETIDLDIKLNILKIRPLKDKKEYLQELISISDTLLNKNNNFSIKCVDGLAEVIEKGLTNFSRSTFQSAQTDYNNTQNKFKEAISAGVSISSENITTSADGLVIYIELTEGYKLNINDDEYSIIKDKSGEFEEQTIKLVVNEKLLSSLVKAAETNVAILNGNQSSINIILSNAELRAGIETFSKTINNLLANDQTLSKTRQLAFNYCALFSNLLFVINQEIKTIEYSTRFIIAFNALILNIVSQTTDKQKGE